MSAYTEGRLRMHFDCHIVSYTGEPYCNLVKESGSRALVPEAIAEKVRMSNARRLAACWNACDGIATEVIEKKRPIWWVTIRAMLAPAEQLDAKLTAAEAELAAARALLAEVLTDDDEIIADLRADGFEPDADSRILLTERIRTLLEPKP